MNLKKISLVLLLVAAPILYFSLPAEVVVEQDAQVTAPVNTDTQPKQHSVPPMIAKAAASITSPKPVSLDAPEPTTEPKSAIERIRAIQDKNALHKMTLQDYDNFSRYPSNNVRIQAAGQDPILKRYEIDERTTSNDDRTASMTIWSDKKYYQRGDQVSLFARLVDANGVPINSQFSAQLIYDERKNIRQFDLHDSNRDGLFELSFVADDMDGKRLQVGAYKLLVVNSTNSIADAAVFILTEPTAEFTGNYRDTITKEGNLKVEAEIKVSAKDRFYFQASLYTDLGEAIGVTQLTSLFDKGSHWVPLEFFGLMLHDSEVDGPYVLKNLALARVTMPMQRAPLIHPNYYTQAYQRSQFSSTNYADLAMLK